jgi:hypothetical protein
LRADARGQEQRLRTGQVQFGLDVDWRDYGADRADLSGCQRVVQFADFPQQPFIDLAAGVVAGGLDCPAFWVGGTGDDQQAAAALVGTGDEGIRRREPEIGVDSDGVGFQRGARTKVGLRVSATASFSHRPFVDHRRRAGAGHRWRKVTAGTCGCHPARLPGY